MKYAQLVKAINSTSRQLLGRAVTAVNQSLVIRNWLIGAYLVEFEQRGEDRARYGGQLLTRLSKDLADRGIEGISADMLERSRGFYQLYPQIGSRISATLVRKSAPASLLALPEISATVLRKSKENEIAPLKAEQVLLFSWSQLIELVKITDPLKRAFFENECLRGNWSVRQLQRQIGSLLYERTGLSANKKAVIERARRQERQATIADLIRDPYVLEFTGLAALPEYSESELEKALLDHLQKFLLELGGGFCFEARQKRITIGNKHDFIDLVFYHRVLRCHVLLDLKVRKFIHGDAGQMNFYVNWWKQNVMAEGENPTVEIILCSDREKAEVEYATAGMDNQLFVSRYLVTLPSVELLREFVERDRDRTEALIEQQRQRPKRKK